MQFNKVLITGAHGFAGANLCRALLTRGYDIRALVRDADRIPNLQAISGEIEVIGGDIRDRAVVDRAAKGADLIFHLATASSVVAARMDPVHAADVNIVGTINAATAAIRHNVNRFVHVSTNHVYGNPPPQLLPFNENSPCFPQDIYSVTRYAAERVLKPLIHDGLNVIITRAFNHYGPFQSKDSGLLIPAIVLPILQGRAPNLNNPNPTRDYSHVSDIVRGYIMAAESGKIGKTYIFASGVETSVGELASMLIRLHQQEFGQSSRLRPIYREHRRHDLLRSCGDASCARQELQWTPNMELDEGLIHTLYWWREQLERVS